MNCCKVPVRQILKQGTQEGVIQWFQHQLLLLEGGVCLAGARTPQPFTSFIAWLDVKSPLGVFSATVPPSLRSDPPGPPTPLSALVEPPPGAPAAARGRHNSRSGLQPPRRLPCAQPALCGAPRGSGAAPGVPGVPHRERLLPEKLPRGHGKCQNPGPALRVGVRC